MIICQGRALLYNTSEHCYALSIATTRDRIYRYLYIVTIDKRYFVNKEHFSKANIALLCQYYREFLQQPLAIL